MQTPKITSLSGLSSLSVYLLFVLIGFLLASCGGGGGSSNATSGGNSTAVITVTLPPMVIAKSTDGTSGAVDPAAAISVTFNKDIDPLTVTSATFTIGGVSGSVSYSAATKTATFTPSAALAYSTKYTATITTGVNDLAGNAMASAFTWSFTTKQNPLPASTYLKGGAIQGSALYPEPTVVTTLAGSGSLGGVDAIGTAASFSTPRGITTDGTNLYVSDVGNYRIRKIVIATGQVTTLAGSGVAGALDGIGTAASFRYPSDITTDGTNLYVADAHNHNIRKIVITSGQVTTLAGSGVAGALDGTGTAASFRFPEGITTDGINLYVSDVGNYRIRKIVIATGQVTTLAGSSPGAVDGIGTGASFNTPTGITTDGINLYVTDSNNNKIRKIVIATGQVTTVASYITNSWGITTDGVNLYVAVTGTHQINKIVIATGVVTFLAGSGNNLPGAVDGTSPGASFNSPVGITTDGINLYVADMYNNKIRKISPSTAAPSSSPTGVTTTVGDGWATISWNDVADATSYNLYCTTGASVTTATGSKIANVSSRYPMTHYWTAGPTNPSTSLSNGTTYSCLVTAVNDYGESVPSSPVVFTPVATHNLSVSLSNTNNGSGSVTSSPAGISCGSTCIATVTNGATITLVAAPASGSTFTGWSGACSGMGTCTITLDSDKTVTAAFQGTSTPPPPPPPASCFTASGNICMSVTSATVNCVTVPPWQSDCSGSVAMNITSAITSGLIQVRVFVTGLDTIEGTISVTPNTAPGVMNVQIPTKRISNVLGCSGTALINVYDGPTLSTSTGSRLLWAQGVPTTWSCI